MIFFMIYKNHNLKKKKKKKKPLNTYIALVKRLIFHGIFNIASQTLIFGEFSMHLDFPFYSLLWIHTKGCIYNFGASINEKIMSTHIF